MEFARFSVLFYFSFAVIKMWLFELEILYRLNGKTRDYDRRGS